MSGEKYPTLSSSLAMYTGLVAHVQAFSKSPQALEMPQLQDGLNACLEKLLKFFDKSTLESEYYYHATSAWP
jgi:hypothetical protein